MTMAEVEKAIPSKGFICTAQEEGDPAGQDRNGHSRRKRNMNTYGQAKDIANM